MVKKLTIANWECGVLLPGTIDETTSNGYVPGKNKGTSKGIEGKASRLIASEGKAPLALVNQLVNQDSIELLGGKLDLPFLIPARRYDEGEKPWMQTGTW